MRSRLRIGDPQVLFNAVTGKVGNSTEAELKPQKAVAHKHVILGSQIRERCALGINTLWSKADYGFWAAQD
jgi:carbonic anhydrase/acetyltransferase-like protein (isoleucine patch superfamily)